MSFKLIKEAVYQTKYSSSKKKTINVLETLVGKEQTRTIIEGYQIDQDDYSKWLNVIQGYASDEGLNLKTKSAFQDVAYAVLDNDPAPIDQDLQDVVVNTLWANYKAQQQHSKVEKVVRAREEEEQLAYAIKKMKPTYEENEEFDNDDFDYDYDPRGEDFPVGTENDDWDDLEHDEDHDDLESDSPSWEQESKWSKQRDQEFNTDENDEDDESFQSRPKTYYASENEEQTSYGSLFARGQLVTNKKDGATYKIEIPDGPGDNVGIMVQGRIKMVPSKDLTANAAVEDEESRYTSKQPTKVSFLHDVLTGENSRDHLSKLQKQIEAEAANEWTRHHAKLPKNPHPRGSIAYKAWDRGISSAAKEVWAPKPIVVDQKGKTKPKKR